MRTRPAPAVLEGPGHQDPGAELVPTALHHPAVDLLVLEVGHGAPGTPETAAPAV